MKIAVIPLALLGALSLNAVAVEHADPGDRGVDEVTAAMHSFYAALNRADPVAADRFLLPGGDSFPRSGKKLDPEAGTAAQSLLNLRAGFDAGLRFHVTLRDLQVKSYGTAAIATLYTDGETTAPDRSITNGTFRATYVWVRQPAGWQIAHFHISALK
jgi:ketosteroid isomerase-like protein